jgi:hypothetical protein
LNLGSKWVDSQNPDLFLFLLHWGLPVWGEGLLCSLKEVDVLGLEWRVREGWGLMATECFWISVAPQSSEWMDILVAVAAASRLVLVHQGDVFSKLVLPQIQQDLVELFLVPLEPEGETVGDLREQGQLQE